MGFIWRSQSAAGSITSCRDVKQPGRVRLKGKRSMSGTSSAMSFTKNDELYNRMQSLNIGGQP